MILPKNENLSFRNKKRCKKGIKLPRSLTRKLAEDIGWFIGDGCMGIYNKDGNKTYYIKIAGNPTEEKLFYDNVIVPTKRKLYGINLEATDIGDGSYGVRIYSKPLVLFYNETIGIPLSPKKNITIPDLVKNSKNTIVLSCVRGIFDTDGTLTFKRKRKSIHHFPLIQIESISKALISDLQKILRQIGFKPFVEFDMERPTKLGYMRVTHRLSIYGKRNLDKWVHEIGFKNPKHLTKYRIWKKFGFCPARTTLKERFEILNGKLSPDNFYKD
jgi:hypothetical protein